MAVAQPCSLHEQDCLLFQPATSGKEGKTPGKGSGRNRALLSWGTQAWFLRLSNFLMVRTHWRPGCYVLWETICVVFLIAPSAFPTKAESRDPPESPSESKLSRNSFIQLRPGASYKPGFSSCSEMHTIALLCLPWTSGLQPGPRHRREKKSSHDSKLFRNPEQSI